MVLQRSIDFLTMPVGVAEVYLALSHHASGCCRGLTVSLWAVGVAEVYLALSHHASWCCRGLTVSLWPVGVAEV